MINPIIRLDYPDPEVIRVEDTYYMISTTMHFMPGGAILRSYNLKDWELLTYLYDILGDTPANGAMIGSQAYYEALAGHFADLSLNAMPTMPIDEEF